MPDNFFFTAVGASGTPIEETATLRRKLTAIRRYVLAGRDHQHPDFVAHYGNPGEIPDNWPCSNPRSKSYCWFNDLTDGERLAQADTLLSTNNARNSGFASMLGAILSNNWKSSDVQSEILGAPNRTRGQLITDVAPQYGLDPRLVAAIILTEQRDASEAGDVIEYTAGFHHGRMATSIGLGQVRGDTHNLYNLLDGVFEDHYLSFLSRSNRSNIIFRFLADDALNIHATAKYIRLLADQAAELQADGTNRMYDADSNCTSPPNGQYVNQALRDLSVLDQPAANWVTLPDSTLPENVPSSLTRRSDGSPTTASQDKWDRHWRGNYYIRLIGGQYTSCPFDPGTLEFGITWFTEDPPGSNDWVFEDSKRGQVKPSSWGDFVSDAFVDVDGSSHI